MLKYSALKQKIVADIAAKKRAPGTRIPGVRDIMAKHKVSQNTVASALKELAREGIIELRHGSGIYVRDIGGRRTVAIGLILTEADNPFLSRFLEALTSAKDEHAFNIITKVSGFDPIREREAADALQAAGAKAIMLLPEPAGVNHRHFAAIDKRGIPVVNVIRRFADADCAYVVPDNHRAGVIAAEHLIAKGSRNLVYIGSSVLSRIDERREGFSSAAEKAGIDMSRRRFVSIAEQNTVEEGMRAFARAKEQIKTIDGVFAFHDIYAAGVLRHCLKNGIRVPEDIRLIGCDDLDIAACLTPSLTTIDYGMDTMAAKALSIIDDRLAGREPERSDITLTPRLIIRESA
ncbi:MAG: LacI family DNA-binding transcriptional regulator [Spirochaetota bacterium]